MMKKHRHLFVIAIVCFLSPLATISVYKIAKARPHVIVPTMELPEMVVSVEVK